MKRKDLVECFEGARNPEVFVFRNLADSILVIYTKHRVRSRFMKFQVRPTHFLCAPKCRCFMPRYYLYV